MVVEGRFGWVGAGGRGRGPCGWIRSGPRDSAETIKSCRSTCISGSSSGGGFCTGWRLWSLHIRSTSRKPFSTFFPLDFPVSQYGVR